VSGLSFAFDSTLPPAFTRDTVTVSFAVESQAFSGVSPVPEASTWALLAVGLIAVRLASRRRFER
jgi:hypothetical protein